MKANYFMTMFIALMLIMSGCVSKSEYEQKLGELDAVKKENSGLKEQLKEKDSQVSILTKSKSELEKKVRAEYRSILEKLGSQKDSIQKQLFEKSKSLSQLQRVISQKEKSLGELQQLLSQKTNALVNMQEQFNNLQLSSVGDMSKISKFKEQLTLKDTALKDKDARIASKDAAVKEKDDKINALMKQIEALTSGGSPGMEGVKGLLNR